MAWSIHCLSSSMGGWAPYCSLAGMFMSSMNITLFLPNGGPNTPFLLLSSLDITRSCGGICFSPMRHHVSNMQATIIYCRRMGHNIEGYIQPLLLALISVYISSTHLDLSSSGLSREIDHLHTIHTPSESISLYIILSSHPCTYVYIYLLSIDLGLTSGWKVSLSILLRSLSLM